MGSTLSILDSCITLRDDQNPATIFRNNRLKLFFSLTLLLIPVAGATQTVHIGHCLQGCPTGSAVSNELIVRNLYTVSINQQTRLADWVVYRVLKDTVGVASLLPREWNKDTLLFNGLTVNALDGQDSSIRQPNLDNQQDRDYRIMEVIISAGDWGRLLPMSSFAGTPYWSDLNFLSVMSYMKPAMRSGPWSRLDQAINRVADAHGEVFITAGPLYVSKIPLDNELIAESNFPAAFFKVVATTDGLVSAFIFAQESSQHQAYCQQISSLESVERQSGLDLFPQTNSWPLGSLNSKLGC
jgi:endonuclease G, mitochondrial